MAEAKALVAPAPVTSVKGESFSLAPSLVGSLPTPAYGYIHQFGAFQITATTAEGMFMLGHQGNFPHSEYTVDFYHAGLTYVGRYTDPDTNISGFLYETEVGPPIEDKRFFLFGDQNLKVTDPHSNGVRWIVYYNSKGDRTYSTTARFYRP